MRFPRSDVDAFRKIAGGGQAVLVSTHIHPDPDAIGSALAVREMLLQMGAKPRVILSEDVPTRCRILPGADQIETMSKLSEVPSFPAAVIVDSGNLSRIGEVQKYLAADAFVVNLDHHFSNNLFGALNFVDRECAATAELLFGLVRDLNLSLTPSLADNLFAGLLTDTGRFRYPNTSARVFQIAADLMEAGANVTKITNGMYFDISATDILSMGAIFSTLERFGNGRVSTMFVRLENRVEDPDSVVDLAVSVRGVQAAALLSETPEGKIRVSLRSKCAANMASIAESFGGGGHEKAAGFRRIGTLESVRETLLPVLLDAVNQAGNGAT